MDEFHFNGKIAAVTFGSSKIAQSLIIELVSKGAQVYTFVPFALNIPCKQYFSLQSFCDKLRSLPKIDILVNVLPGFCFNENICEDFSCVKEKLYSVFDVVKAVWAGMRKNKHGRILGVFPAEVFYSRQGSAAESVCCLAWQGMMNALKREGAKFWINVNSLLYSAETHNEYKQDKVIPVALYMIHKSFSESGSIIEVSEDSIKKLRVQRGSGKLLKNSTPETVSQHFEAISQIGEHPDYPSAYSESLLKILFMNVLERPRI